MVAISLCAEDEVEPRRPPPPARSRSPLCFSRCSPRTLKGGKKAVRVRLPLPVQRFSPDAAVAPRVPREVAVEISVQEAEELVLLGEDNGSPEETGNHARHAAFFAAWNVCRHRGSVGCRRHLLWFGGGRVGEGGTVG